MSRHEIDYQKLFESMGLEAMGELEFGVVEIDDRMKQGLRLSDVRNQDAGAFNASSEMHGHAAHTAAVIWETVYKARMMLLRGQCVDEDLCRRLVKSSWNEYFVEWYGEEAGQAGEQDNRAPDMRTASELGYLRSVYEALGQFDRAWMFAEENRYSKVSWREELAELVSEDWRIPEHGLRVNSDQVVRLLVGGVDINREIELGWAGILSNNSPNFLAHMDVGQAVGTAKLPHGWAPLILKEMEGELENTYSFDKWRHFVRGPAGAVPVWMLLDVDEGEYFEGLKNNQVLIGKVGVVAVMGAQKPVVEHMLYAGGVSGVRVVSMEALMGLRLYKPARAVLNRVDFVENADVVGLVEVLMEAEKPRSWDNNKLSSLQRVGWKLRKLEVEGLRRDDFEDMGRWLGERLVTEMWLMVYENTRVVVDESEVEAKLEERWRFLEGLRSVDVDKYEDIESNIMFMADFGYGPMRLYRLDGSYTEQPVYRDDREEEEEMEDED